MSDLPRSQTSPSDNSEPAGVAGSLLAALEADGDLVDEGGFSIDGAQARAKLRDFLLAEAEAYVLLLVEAAVLGGADPVRVDSEGGVVSVELGALAFERAELEHLFAAVFAGPGGADDAERRRRRVLQKLAHACNAALRLNPRAIIVESGPPEGSGLRLRLTPDDDRGVVESVELAPGTRVRVELGALAAVSVVTSAELESREAELVRERCVYSPVTIQLGDERVSRGLREALYIELTPDDLSFAPRPRKLEAIELDGRPIGWAALRYSGKLPAELTIVTNGVLAERGTFGDQRRRAAPDFGAVVDVDLARDLGQNKLLRGPELERVMDAIWAVHDRIAPEDFGEPGSGHVAPASKGDLGLFGPVILISVGLLLVWAGVAEDDWQGVIVALFAAGVVLAGLWWLFRALMVLRSKSQ